MTSPKRALIFSFANRYMLMIIKFVSVLALARLLTPEEIGIYSITAALFALGQIIRDFGVGNYLVQVKDLTKDRIASAFTISLMICTTLAFFFYLISGSIAEFYELPAMESLLILLSINLLMTPFGAMTLSVLSREMAFDKIFVISQVSSVVNTCVAVGLAYLDYGYLSLAYASLAGTLTTVLVAQVYRPKILPWLPGLKSIHEVFSFGWKMSATNIFNHIQYNAADLVLGKVMGPIVVAVYNRANSAVNLFNDFIIQAVGPVLKSYFSEINRENVDLKEPYLKAVSYNLAMCWPFFAFLALHADIVILLLFGDQWGEAAPLVVWFCIAASLSALTVYFEQYFVSTGQANRFLKMSLILMIAAVLILAFYSQIGLNQAVIAMVVLPLIRLVILIPVLKEQLSIHIKDYLQILWQPFVITLIVAVAAYALPNLLIEIEIPLVNFAALSFTIGVIWLISLIVVKHPLSSMLLEFVGKPFQHKAQ